MNQDPSGTFLFPKWVDRLRDVLAVTLFGVLPAYLVILVWYGGSPKTTDVGYAPAQPIPYSHELHAGQLGIDCRYCHNTVEVAAHAAIPPTQTCLNCHAKIRTTSPKLAVLRESYTTGMSIPWVKVHDLPDYAYFNHSAHVSRGVGCVECHGRVDKMEVVSQVKPLSMGWCLDCHRNPEARLRPVDQVTNMAWQPEGDRVELGKRLRAALDLNPSQECSTCHR